ncbi:Vacuolar protein-sorting-associated protein 36 [Nowakowskiella sp. JEL0078]|nr:Vacuolar protein-sorting-associated protein 36 [Nowakowskiella sp. JEL0078]
MALKASASTKLSAQLFFAPVELQQTASPALLPSESFLLLQNNVGVYDGWAPLIALQGYLTRSPKLSLSLSLDVPQSQTLSLQKLSFNSTVDPTCPVCTFLNHEDLLICEMCNASLNQILNDGPEDGERSANVSNTTSKELAEIKLSFRSGGCEQFVKHVRDALATKAWLQKPESQPPSVPTPTASRNTGQVGGIAGIMRNTDESSKQINSTLSIAFQDLSALIASASEMVKLAETIAKKVGTSEDSSEPAQFNLLVAGLGIASPVTKEVAGDLYTSELAREVAGLLERLEARSGGLVSLVDLYCVVNRARGVALISPEDLVKACTQFEKLELPFRMRVFASGLKVVQSDILFIFLVVIVDDVVAARVEQLTREKPGITAVEVARAGNVSLVVAMEQLLVCYLFEHFFLFNDIFVKVTEMKGLICRDDTIEGLRFFENKFLTFEI